MLENLKKVPHALLIVGNYDLTNFIENLVQSKKRSHPDVHHYHPEGRSGLHSIESLRDLQMQAALVPLEAPIKLFILHDAERMLPTSSNALLKTLEEPPSRTVIILKTDNENALLPTIRSRCQTYRFPKQDKKKDPLFEPLHAAFLGDRKAINEIDAALEQEKKQLEKKLLAALPKEMSMAQKESMIKEIEGEISLNYQTHIFTLFEELLIWQRDELARRVGSKHILSDKCVPFRPLSKLVEKISKARLAVQRGMKFTSIFEYLL